MSTDRIILAACSVALPWKRSGIISLPLAAGLPGAELAPAAPGPALHPSHLPELFP